MSHENVESIAVDLVRKQWEQHLSFRYREMVVGVNSKIDVHSFGLQALLP